MGCSFIMKWDSCGISKKVKTLNITFHPKAFPKSMIDQDVRLLNVLDVLPITPDQRQERQLQQTGNWTVLGLIT